MPSMLFPLLIPQPGRPSLCVVGACETRETPREASGCFHGGCRVLTPGTADLQTLRGASCPAARLA